MEKTLLRKVNSLPAQFEPNGVYLVLKNIDGQHSVYETWIADATGTKTIKVDAIPTISGDTSIYVGYPNTYQITNYGTDRQYVVHSDDGEISINGDQVTFTVTNAALSTAKFTINQTEYTVTVKTTGVQAPTITSMVDGATDVDYVGLTVTSSAFALDNPQATDTQVSADWQIATDPNFENIVFQSLNDTTNLNSITVP